MPGAGRFLKISEKGTEPRVQATARTHRADVAHVENTETDSGFLSFTWIHQTEKRAYSLASDILRAAKVLGVGSGLWKERETKSTYRNPRGAGRDENQRSELTANNRGEVIQGKCGGRMGGWGG